MFILYKEKTCVGLGKYLSKYLEKMEEVNVNLLVDAKKEYTRQLQNILKPLIYEGFASIYKEATEIDKGNTLPVFQDLLANVPKWNQDIIEKEAERIVKKSGCNYLDDLITAVFVSNTKILSSIRIGDTKEKTLDLQIPKMAHFVHHCYIESAREIFKDPYLFEKKQDVRERQRKMRECLEIINGCIEDAVRKMLPVEQIIHKYLNMVYDDAKKESVKEEKLSVTKNESESEESESEESEDLDSVSGSGTEESFSESEELSEEEEHVNVNVEKKSTSADSEHGEEHVEADVEEKRDYAKEGLAEHIEREIPKQENAEPEVKSIFIGDKKVATKSVEGEDKKEDNHMDKLDQLLEKATASIKANSVKAESEKAESVKEEKPITMEVKKVSPVEDNDSKQIVLAEKVKEPKKVMVKKDDSVKKIRYFNSRKEEKLRNRTATKEINLDDFPSKNESGKFSFFDDAKTDVSAD